MSGTLVEITFDFPDFLGALRHSQERIEQAIASTVQTQIGMRFDQEGASNGHEKWAPLKMRRGQILSLSGALRKSISPPGADGNPGPQGYVTHTGDLSDLRTAIGTKLIYASTHDHGAKIVPRNKRALRFMNPMLGKFVFSKSVTIPARPFTDMNQRDKDELEQTVVNVVEDILAHAGSHH